MKLMNSIPHTDTQVKKMSAINIDTQVKKISATARERAFENSTRRQSSRFERVLIETIMSDEMMNTKTALAVHRADSVSDRERDRERKRERKREEREERRERKRERRDREQAALSKET